VNRLEAFIQGDRMIQLFGMEIDEAAEGFARVSATVHEEFLNTHNVAHGALIFALIDVAFAICVNAVIDAMGVQWSFNILRAARPGDRVIAECRTIHKGSRLIVVEYEARTLNNVLLAKGQATALPVRGAAEARGDASSG
jgi:acyl-CoA thioesterase